MDDKPDNIFSLRNLLNLHNFEVDSATSGEEALKKILNKVYSLIILDVQMPDMDGFEVAEAISGFNKAKDTPIIFLSAISKEKKYITRGYTSGGTDYVTKPIDPDILLLKVKTLYKLSEQTKDLNRVQHSLKEEIEVRRQAQDKLALSMNELHSVMESMPLIAFTVNKNGQIDYVNEQWYEFSALPDVFPAVHPDDEEICSRWKRALAEGLEFNSEVRLKKLNGDSYKYHFLKIKPIIQDEVIVKWVGTFMDIHHQRSLNELLEQKVRERTMDLTQKNEELETRNHELQQFAWVASHDLKEPLRKIQTFNHLIRDRYLQNNTEALPLLDKIIRSSERMSSLIDNLLNYSRLSASSLFQPTDLSKILEEITSDLEVSICEKQASIRLGQFPVIDTIPSQIRQVFQNLISNGLKFSRKDVAPEISISCDFVNEKQTSAPPVSEGRFCRIHVQDNGIGFEEEFIDKIFVIFQRLHSRDAYEGTGIGLAITKKIIEKHNGIISARSSVNRGSVFTLVIPVKNNSTTK